MTRRPSPPRGARRFAAFWRRFAAAGGGAAGPSRRAVPALVAVVGGTLLCVSMLHCLRMPCS